MSVCVIGHHVPRRYDVMYPRRSYHARLRAGGGWSEDAALWAKTLGEPSTPPLATEGVGTLHAHQCLDGVRSTFKKCQKMKIAFPIYNCPLLKRRSGRPDLLSTTVSYVFICSRRGQIATASCMERARIGLNSIVSETHAVASAERDMAPDLQET